MTADDKKYLQLVAIHAVLGYVIFLAEQAAKLYALGIVVAGVYFIIRKRNANNEALYAAAYMVGAEVFLRMTGANLLYEYGKYVVVAFVLIGIYFKGFSKNAYPYGIFLLLLIPGIILATQTLGPDVEIRKTISFNMSGPVCLGICAMYCYQRKITYEVMYDTLLALGLPILAVSVFLLFKTPDLREAIIDTSSNFATSGGFGPNQVATILGLGIFVFFSRIVFNSRNKFMLFVNLAIVLHITFRGLITFSRGGIITGIVMIVVLLCFTFFKVNASGRSKLSFLFVGALVVFFGIWAYSSMKTGGLIEKRYANQDASGRVKEDKFSGREELAATEIDYFLSNPVFGIGVARGTELREISGTHGLSHNEMTRMLAEHGAFGILGLLILMVTPFVLYLDNKGHVFLLAFVVFWLLTINHAAMRLAAPAFVYALSLLKITGYEEEKPAVHRQ